ncbi:hypothetical protein SAMN05444366_0165 [Flavobacterium saccharophilum]|uniref:Uncharacterized protein n=1 Tax=Flavobacterium saccharophilum TaxID=29534 RepID=A0A1M6Z8Q7_9FLAO|nr:hypothetical protein SAMN05444366_0165 [Flavobacterium saccharophilum]
MSRLSTFDFMTFKLKQYETYIKNMASEKRPR